MKQESGRLTIESAQRLVLSRGHEIVPDETRGMIEEKTSPKSKQRPDQEPTMKATVTFMKDMDT